MRALGDGQRVLESPLRCEHDAKSFERERIFLDLYEFSKLYFGIRRPVGVEQSGGVKPTVEQIQWIALQDPGLHHDRLAGATHRQQVMVGAPEQHIARHRLTSHRLNPMFFRPGTVKIHAGATRQDPVSFGKRRIDPERCFLRRASEGEPLARRHAAGRRMERVVHTEDAMRQREFRIEGNCAFQKFLAAGK